MPNSPTKDANNRKIDIAIAKYQLANDRNILESQAQWNRSNVFLIFNTILITAITLSYQDNSKFPWTVTFILPIAGLFTCLLWYLMNLSGFKWIDHWIVAARKIERKYLKDNELELNPILSGYELKEKNKSWPNAEVATNILIGAIAIIYFIFLCHTIKFNCRSRFLRHNTFRELYWQRNYDNKPALEYLFLNLYSSNENSQSQHAQYGKRH